MQLFYISYPEMIKKDYSDSNNNWLSWYGDGYDLGCHGHSYIYTLCDNVQIFRNWGYTNVESYLTVWIDIVIGILTNLLPLWMLFCFEIAIYFNSYFCLVFAMLHKSRTHIHEFAFNWGTYRCWKYYRTKQQDTLSLICLQLGNIWMLDIWKKKHWSNLKPNTAMWKLCFSSRIWFMLNFKLVCHLNGIMKLKN